MPYCRRTLVREIWVRVSGRRYSLIEWAAFTSNSGRAGPTNVSEKTRLPVGRLGVQLCRAGRAVTTVTTAAAQAVDAEEVLELLLKVTI
jgi:hypothetical protein